jgi:hypothetical protein
MGVTPIGYPSLTQADVRAIRARGAQLVDRGLSGGCISVETEHGDLVVAVLGADGQSLLYAFGKDQGWYYVTDPEGVPVAQGRLIEDVLAIFSGPARH